MNLIGSILRLESAHRKIKRDPEYATLRWSAHAVSKTRLVHGFLRHVLFLLCCFIVRLLGMEATRRTKRSQLLHGRTHCIFCAYSFCKLVAECFGPNSAVRFPCPAKRKIRTVLGSGLVWPATLRNIRTNGNTWSQLNRWAITDQPPKRTWPRTRFVTHHRFGPGCVRRILHRTTHIRKVFKQRTGISLEALLKARRKHIP